MNWYYLILVFIFMLVFILLLASVLFYFRHWASREAAKNNHNISEGLYFKRYIPEQLRPIYDKNIVQDDKLQNTYNRTFWAKVASVSIILSAVSISVYSLTNNLHLFRQTIDISSDEIKKLDFTKHKWKRQVDHNIPNLNTILDKNKITTLVIPYTRKDSEWLVNGFNIRSISINHWENFAKKNNLKIKVRNWDEIANATKLKSKEVLLVLPGFWNIKTLDRLLTNGTNIIVYGPPAQLFTATHNNKIQWQGLTFEEEEINKNVPLIIRGDQLLTLGFDAGIIVKAYTPLPGFRTTSESPQAVSIANTESAGGVNETRLYAKTHGKGRLVWLNFAPAVIDNSPNINIRHLNALMASIFRYLQRENYSSISMWPEARHYAALVEEDTEDKFANSTAIKKIFKHKNYPISWYILSNEALKNRQLTLQLSKYGEVACHGDNHSSFTQNTHREQIIRIARCQKVIKALTGVKPLAFRPPQEEYNSDTIDAIANNGMTHYIANNKPDRAVPEIQRSLLNNTLLVSIPRIVSDDFEMWHTRNLNKTETIDLINDEIRWTKQIGGLYMYSFHTQFMNTTDNLHAIEFLLEKINQSNAYFSTSKNIAEWWRFRNALQNNEPTDIDQYMRFKPFLMSVTEDGHFHLELYPINIHK